MRHTMKNTPQEIKEGLASDISSQLLYCLFIDLFPISNRKGGLLTIMFPNVTIRKMSRWLGNLPETETYTTNLEKLKDISRKFGANSTLKSLYRVVNSVKTKETDQEANPERIADIELVMSKIQRIIKSRLTPEEKNLFLKLSKELTDAAENASKSIEGSVGASTIKPEKPKEEPVEEPEEEPIEEPEEEEPEQEEPVEEPTEEPAPEPKKEPAPAPTPATPAQNKPATPPTPSPKKAEPSPQKPAEKPMEKPAPTPVQKPTEKPTGEPEEEEKTKKESVQLEKEVFEARLKALIKEIVRERLGL